MSINNEINRITTNIASAYVAAAEKNATMPELQNSANLAATILSIPQEPVVEPGPTVAVIGDAEYSSVIDALAAAVNGDTVQMVADAAETECVNIPEGVTLDLNGYTLTADYVYGVGNLVDNSAENTGTLSSGHVRLSKNNRHLPVRIAENQYRFYKVLQINSANVTPPNEGAIKYAFVPYIEATAHEYLKQSMETSGVSILVLVTWNRSDGIVAQDYLYSSANVINFLNSYKASTGKYGNMFTYVHENVANFDGLTYTAYVVSDIGPEFSTAHKDA